MVTWQLGCVSILRRPDSCPWSAVKTTSSSSAFFTSITEFFLMSFRSHLRPKLDCRHVYVRWNLFMHVSNSLLSEGAASASASRIDVRFQFLIYKCSVSFLLFCLCVHGFCVLWIGCTSKIFQFFSRFLKNVRTILF